MIKSQVFSYDRIGDSTIFYIKLRGEQLAAADEPTAKAVVEAGNNYFAHLEDLLRVISEQHCGVKIEGEVTLDMVPSFVEGQIDKQSDRADHAENFIRDLAQYLGVEFNGIDRTCPEMQLVVKSLREDQKALNELISKSGQPQKANGKAPSTELLEQAVRNFLNGWDGSDITLRSTSLAPLVRQLRDVMP